MNEIMEGQVPPNVEAGVAIDLLQEAAADRHAPQILMLEKALERAGNMMLELAQKYYTEPRMLVINGAGSRPKVKRFESADIVAGVGTDSIPSTYKQILLFFYEINFQRLF